MKKIEKQADLEKKARKNQIIIGVVMIVLLTASTLGFALMRQGDQTTTSKKEYLGQTFVQYNGLWNIEKTNLLFQFMPSETFDVLINGTYNINDYSGKTLYFVNYVPEAELIINNLQGQILRYQEACLENCEGDFPVKDCLEDNVIIFVESDDNRVWKEGTCVYISGDYVKGVDSFNYRLYGLR